MTSASIDTSTGVVVVDGTTIGDFGSLQLDPIGECAGIFVIATTDFRVASGATVTVTGTRGLAIVSTGVIIINGTLDVGAHGQVSGPGGLVRTSGGGYGTAGGRNGCTSTAAPTFGDAELTGLCGGSADSSSSGGAGGAIELASLVSVAIGSSGVVRAVGGGGPFASTGGRGGSGGAVLLEAPLVRVAGAISVNGGGGASGSDRAVTGQPGTDGGIRAAATGGMGACILAGCGGGSFCSGSGGGGAWQGAGAADGGTSAVSCSDGGTCVDGLGGGFGGGGAGRIRINATTTDYVAGRALEYSSAGVFTEGWP